MTLHYRVRKPCHWSLLSATYVQFTASHFFLRSVSILSSDPRSAYQEVPFRQFFEWNAPMRATYPYYLPSFYHPVTFLFRNTIRIFCFLQTPSQWFYHFPFLRSCSTSSSLYVISVLLVVMACTVYSTVSLGNLINSKAARQTNAWLEQSLKPTSFSRLLQI
jgi:hypothetical protein